MTINQPTRFPPLAAKAGLVSTVSLGLFIGPVALAAPAQAADHSKHDTCTPSQRRSRLRIGRSTTGSS